MRFELVALIHFESPLKTARFCSQRLAADAGCFFALKRNNIAQKVRLSTVNYEQIVRFRVVLGCFVCYA